MLKIAIVSGTDRPNSKAMVVSTYLASAYNEAGASASIVDLQSFPLNAVVGGPYGKDIAEIKEFNQTVMDADGVVMVIPEYNGSFPGILKLFIDYLPFPSAFEKLPIAFIGESAGSFGALRAVEQLQMVAAYRNALLFPERVFINRVGKNFDPVSGPVDSLQNELMQKQVKNFIGFIERNK